MIHRLRTRHRLIWPLLSSGLIALLWLALTKRAPTAADSGSFEEVTQSYPSPPVSARPDPSAQSPLGEGADNQ